MFEDPSENRTAVTRPRDENFDIAPKVKSSEQEGGNARKPQSFRAILAIIFAGVLCAILSIGLFYLIRDHQHTVIPVETTGPDMTTEKKTTEEETSEVLTTEEKTTGETTESEEETEESTEETESSEESAEQSEEETTEPTETASEETEKTETETEVETSETETTKPKKKKKKKESSQASETETETQPSETESETQVSDFEYGGVIYRTNKSGLTLVKCYSADSIMEMGPVDGVPITAIASNAFSGCDHLEQINLPEGLKKIGEKAFKNCRNLTEVWVPASVTKIADNAFEDSVQAKIVAAAGTYAQAYAGTHEITFIEGSRVSALN